MKYIRIKERCPKCNAVSVFPILPSRLENLPLNFLVMDVTCSHPDCEKDFFIYIQMATYSSLEKMIKK